MVVEEPTREEKVSKTVCFSAFCIRSRMLNQLKILHMQTRLLARTIHFLCLPFRSSPYTVYGDSRNTKTVPGLKSRVMLRVGFGRMLVQEIVGNVISDDGTGIKL